ncbi:MAG: FHA domain-containing protein [Lachnospiraceae bacterium]
MNKLTIFIGNQEPQIYDLDEFKKDDVTFGRGSLHGGEGAPQNDIRVAKDVVFVSRAHCTFHKRNNSWYISDDGSVNGIEFNNSKISEQQIHDGDKYYIGKSVNERCVISVSISNGEVNADTLPDRFSLQNKERYLIGRDRDCDLRINHPSVSRHHCIITKENGAFYIADNNSMNGVILNGTTLSQKTKLQQMDKIVIADTFLLFCDNFLYFIQNVGGVSVVANNICKIVKSKGQEKYITDHVNLSIEPGEFVAIIGGSGAGKTTLLNCLSGMAKFNYGDVMINGESIKSNSRSIRSIIGYVPQNDIVYDNLTLEKMLFYSAQLRMPKDTSKEEINRKIEETLDMVELKAHRNTVISRLSGGQKKRASIAVELLASPKLFFLDEPSSGLDPGTEKNLMALLKKLASSGKTVIMVTHTVQNIGMCDRVICMGNGGLLCFSGRPEHALKFFGKENMTDIYEDLNEHSKEVSQRYSRMTNNQRQGESPKQDVTEKKEESKKNGMHQFIVMTKRYAEITFRSKSRLLLLMLMPLILALLVCIAFQADGNLYNYLGLSVDRTSLPFLVGGDTMRLMFAFSCAAFWVGIFNSIQEISKEQLIYRREQFTGVKPFPYVMSKVVITGMICVVQSVILTLVFVFLTNTIATIDGNMESATALTLSMNESGIVFSSLPLEIFVTTVLTLISAMSLGFTISAATSNDMALVICPVCLLPQILFAGVACDLSGFTEKISNFITCRWSCIAYFASSAINDMYESCTYETGSWTMTDFSNGFGIDEAYSAYKTYLFGLNPVLSAWVALILMSVVCIVAAVLLLRFKKQKK